jgi:hypothetical protein
MQILLSDLFLWPNKSIFTVCGPTIEKILTKISQEKSPLRSMTKNDAFNGDNIKILAKLGQGEGNLRTRKPLFEILKIVTDEVIHLFPLLDKDIQAAGRLDRFFC